MGDRGCVANLLHEPDYAASMTVDEPIAKEIAQEKDSSSSSFQNFERRMSTSSVSSGPSNSSCRKAKSNDRGMVHMSIGKDFPRRPIMCSVSGKVWDKMRRLFEKMDRDGKNVITRDKATAFFTHFKSVNTEAMFNEVDADESGAITADEFVDFWLQVRSNGYSEAQILEELEQIFDGGTWVDWQDDRDTGKAKTFKFPKRPIFCKLSSKLWSKIKDLFLQISGGQAAITQERAIKHFKGSFANVSTEAMFNEVDIHGHGSITVQQFIDFWVQVKHSGYKEWQILEEMDQL